MRGQKQQGKQMRQGRTIVAERERAETESERMRARRKVHRKKTTAVVIVLLMAIILTLSGYLGMKEFSREHIFPEGREANETQIQAQVVDEDGRGQISERMHDYIVQLEEDFRDVGYRVSKVTIPTGTSRELFVDLDGREGFIKVNIDRETALSVEDAARTLKYLDEHDLHPEYIDVRVSGKAYYK